MQRHPEHFGPYAVLAQIGSGGMGTIYRATDTRLGREVALKVLHRDLDVSGARERFVNEARLVSSLNHPNICTLFDMGEQESDLFLVMEMLHGQSLKDRIAAGPIHAEELRSVALQIAQALEAAHERSIVHRDIKPANIFLLTVDEDKVQVKVLDFGLAKHTSGDARLRARAITRHGATVGTVEYMSPEQACGSETDARSDLFSLGAVLYEMATGKVPFRGATSAVIYSELLNSEPLPARDENLDLPADLDRVIQSLLQKAPGQRIQTASELVRMLSQPCSEERQCRGRSQTFQVPVQALTQRSLPPILESIPGQVGPRRHRPRLRSSRRRTVLRGVLVCLMLFLLVTTVRIAWAGRAHQPVFHGVLRVRPLINGTGDAALDTAPTDLLKRELNTSSRYGIHLASADGALPSPADGLVTGSVRPVKDGYAVHLEIRVHQSGVRLAEADDTAPSREQVPDAISRAAASLREGLGEVR